MFLPCTLTFDICLLTFDLSQLGHGWILLLADKSVNRARQACCERDSAMAGCYGLRCRIAACPWICKNQELETKNREPRTKN